MCEENFESIAFVAGFATARSMESLLFHKYMTIFSKNIFVCIHMRTDCRQIGRFSVKYPLLGYIEDLYLFNDVKIHELMQDSLF